MSGQTVDNTLQLNKQGGGRIDIPLPKASGLSIIELSKNTSDIYVNNTNLNVTPSPSKSDWGSSYTVSTYSSVGSTKYVNPQNIYSDSNTINLLKNINAVTSDNQIGLSILNQTGTTFYITNRIHITQDATEASTNVPDGSYIGTFVLREANSIISEIINENMQTFIPFSVSNGIANIPEIDVWIDSGRLVSKQLASSAIERIIIPLNRIIKVA